MYDFFEDMQFGDDDNLYITLYTPIHSGDHDMIAPYVGTEEWITSLDLPIERAWDPWYIGIQIGG